MSTHLKHPPWRRVLRTASTLLLSLPVIVPAIVGLLRVFGYHPNEAALVAIAGATVLLVTRVRAQLADAGDAPVLRTLVQLIPAVAAVVATGIADLNAAGWSIDGARLLAALGALQLLLASAQNALEAKGVLPELGAPSEAELLVRTDNAVSEADGDQTGPVTPQAFTSMRMVAARAGSKPSPIRADVDRLIAVAASQVGVSESPPHSNRTPYTAWYGLVGPWCAMFVSWVFWHAGAPLPPIRTKKGFAYCPDIVNWAKRNGVWHPASTRPRRGWIVLFDFPRDGVDRPSHVGIVAEVLADGRISTWEGNTSSGGGRDGGSVVNHRRSIAGGIIGYVQVDHQPAATPTPAKPARPEEWQPIRPGDTDASIARRGGLQTEVTEVQMILSRLARLWSAPELDPGEIDGDYGPKSQAAVRAYKRRIRALQTAMGQAVWPNADDKIGKVTIGSLRWWNGVTGEGR